MPKQINKIPLKEAETNTEKKILGLLKLECEEINYGKLVLEISISGGNIVGLSIDRSRKTIKF